MSNAASPKLDGNEADDSSSSLSTAGTKSTEGMYDNNTHDSELQGQQEEAIHDH